MLQLQHVGKHFPLSLLTPYLLSSQWQSLHQYGCVLAYIPSLVGGASIWATILQKESPRDVCTLGDLWFFSDHALFIGQTQRPLPLLIVQPTLDLCPSDAHLGPDTVIVPCYVWMSST